ncbi:hypothetical protein DIPPA_33429 [Diplonema papillatum]|nr:hypothetical protein DIPPA_33429 [Diplonema papillatum]
MAFFMAARSPDGTPSFAPSTSTYLPTEAVRISPVLGLPLCPGTLATYASNCSCVMPLPSMAVANALILSAGGAACNPATAVNRVSDATIDARCAVVFFEVAPPSKTATRLSHAANPPLWEGSHPFFVLRETGPCEKRQSTLVHLPALKLRQAGA